MSKLIDIGPTTLVTHTSVYPDLQEEFAVIQTKIDKILEQFPGYISHTVLPPNPPVQNDWVIMQQFSSVAAAKEWLQSPDRQKLLDEMAPLLIGNDDIYLLNEGQRVKNNIATVVITNKVKPQYEKEFINWNSKIAAVQAKFPGFVGYKLEKPKPGIQDSWVTILSFDSDEHLKGWLNSSERKTLLKEISKAFDTKSHVRTVYSGFNFWFGNKAQISKARLWKENMLVLLALYPIVFLNRILIDGPFLSKFLPWWLDAFLSCIISVSILATFAVPFLRDKFNWWLNTEESNSKWSNILGIIIVISLYSILLFTFSKISS